jgi:hypothetical protein
LTAVERYEALLAAAEVLDAKLHALDVKVGRTCQTGFGLAGAGVDVGKGKTEEREG